MAPSSSKADSEEPAPTTYGINPSVWQVRDIPERLRPREAMARLGAEHVNDDVLLAILLRSGTAGLNVVDLARGVLRHYGSLTSLAAAPEDELARFDGIGPVKAQVLKAALEVGRRLQEEAQGDTVALRTPADVMRLLAPQACTLDAEVFWAIHVNAKNRMLGRPHEITRGLLDASLVHPREVFRDAIRAGAAAMLVAHNHPSGDPQPSAEDIRITKQLVEAGRVVDVKVLDHVIVGKGPGPGYMSMREEGLVTFA